MKHTQFGRMLAVVGRLMTATALVVTSVGAAAMTPIAKQMSKEVLLHPGAIQEQVATQAVSPLASPVSNFVASARLRVGPSASKYDLLLNSQKLKGLAESRLRGAILPLGSEMEKLEQASGINSQVAFVMWVIASENGTRELNSRDIATAIRLTDEYELRRAWGDNPATTETADGDLVTIPLELNPASAAVLAGLAWLTDAENAQSKIDSGKWASEFTVIFQQYFGGPLESPDVVSPSATSSFVLPFDGRNVFNSGPHGAGSTTVCKAISSSDGSGLDFNAPWVLAIAEGEVIAVQQNNLGGSIGKSVAIRHQLTSGSEVVSMYWHLKSIDSGIYKGRWVSRGTYIGEQGNGYNGAFSTHLHLELRTLNPQHNYMSYSSMGSPIGWDFRTIDSYLISSMYYQGSALNYEGSAVKGTGMSRAFINSRFPCGDGAVRTVYSSVNQCYDKSTIDNFYDHTVFANVSPLYKPAYLQSTNAGVCIAAHTSTSLSPGGCGQDNRPPNTPVPQNPGDWYVSRDGRAPTLCWNNPGDPDGDAVSFYAEIYGSAVNTNSGWTSNTCWRPSDLDGRYYGYQWHVKTKDSRGLESTGWSATWHFNIEAPNAPPTISFNTVNGSGDGTITTHDRNWTFAGTASDPEGQLGRIEFRCSGDGCGSQASHSDGASWSHSQNDMSGQNDVYFVAYDGVGQATASRHVDLRIDLAAPATTLSLNNEANPANWPAWFTAPVQVRLDASDNATGRARAGVREVRYRVDGGAWQTQGGSAASFTVSSDGSHSVEYYAVDNVGNQEDSRTAHFQLDQTPPGPPSGISETHGVVSDQWQRAQNIASFTWAASSDPAPGSGLWGYQFYFGTDPAGVGYQAFLASDPRQWTPQPGGVRTGAYYLRGRTRDLAGNWSAWTDLFTFRYDGTPPENPTGVTHAAGIANDTWQRISNLADFTWPAPHDEGSGVKDYAVYWGADPAGTSSTRISNPQYQSPTPLCGTNEACVGYLRLRSRDQVDNEPADWTTAFVLRYDNAPPVADFTFTEGISTTRTLVNLRLAATDQGSGVREMRLSGDGQSWTSWEVYATERPWTIPAISRQSWPVYLQARDGVGLPSAVVSHTIYLDVNPQQPRSASYRLFDHTLSAGAGAYSSTLYAGRGTLGQVMDSPLISNTQYLLRSGYEAGSQAIPLVEPGHDEFTFINGVFASGTGGATLKSPAYQMLGTLGEVGLPNNETVLVSQGHRLQPGFLAAALPVATPTPTPTPGPTPTPTPTPACEFPRVSINGGALFTNSPNVTLSLCAPWATEMMLSNDGGFGDAQWEPFVATKPWTITTYGQQVLPRFVYAAFKEANGTIHATYFDDIIYDPNAPSGSIAVGDSFGGVMARSIVDHVIARSVVCDEAISSPDAKDCFAQTARNDSAVAAIGPVKYLQRLNGVTLARPVALLAPREDGAVDVYVNANDDNSGLAEMQISASGAFTETAWEPYSALVPYTPEGGDGIKTVYARFKDGAGNVSAPADASFALDTLPPLGGIALARRVVGPDTITTTVYFGAEDNLSGVVNLRVAECKTPSACVPADALADAAWRPYTVTLTWPISLAGQTGGALYVQYRDAAGNVSEVYSDAYTVDTTPPVLYVEVAPGETLTRTVNVFAYDELADLATLRLSNDPLLIEGVVTLPYTPTVTWPFDDRRVVWVQLSDSVGNWTEPYPAYAAPVLAPQAPTAAIGLDAGGVTLTWTHLDANARYEVWRDTRPYFDPTAPTTDTIKLDDVYPPVGGGAITFTDATGDPNVTYYYTVVGVNALGQISAVESYVGVFRFGLTPGE